MSWTMTLSAAGTGLVLFLFAMSRLTGTVQRTVTSTRTRELFRYAVRTPLWGVLTGFLVTILFQSSSATTVLAVGLVSAGLMSFFHSLGVILGADIGTTVTVQLVVWRVTDLSPFLVIGGALLWVLGKGASRSLGEGIFYFGLMFFGLSIIAQATEPLRDNPAILQFFQKTGIPFLGVLIGAGFTALVQSSAIPIALLVILAGHDLLAIERALPFVLGANLGTAATAAIAAAAANAEGRRVAFSHAFFKTIGVLACLILIAPLTVLLQSISASVPQQIALGHIMFNVLVACIFLPLLPLYTRFALWLIPEREEALSLWPEFLDDRLLAEPDHAVAAARKELQREMILARRMCSHAFGLVTRYNSGDMRAVAYMEDVVNALKKEIGGFLRRLSEGPLSENTAKELFLYSSLVNDIERIADHAVNISELAEVKAEKNVPFSDHANRDLSEVLALVEANLDDSLSLMGRNEAESVRNIFVREEQLDRMVADARIRHLDRYYQKICRAEAGPIFIGILVNLERISDHCENIAEYFRDLSGGEGEGRPA